jgi:uncharacterized membrane protein YkvA (DUF1232 family)
VGPKRFGIFSRKSSGTAGGGAELRRRYRLLDCLLAHAAIISLLSTLGEAGIYCGRELQHALAAAHESASHQRIEVLSYRQMTKAKTKSRRKIKTQSAPKNLGQRGPYRKPVLRSDAFAKALADAKSYARNPETLDALFNQAARKAAAVPREAFKENWPYLQAMLRFIRAFSRGTYSPRDVSDDALLWMIAALNYFVDPFDLIPDDVPFLGFVDDATVVEFAVSRTKDTLDDFMTWETAPSPCG